MQNTNGKSHGSAVDHFQKDAYDLKLAEECKTWRQLFNTLKERATHRREKLGQKMRDNRKRENSMRPQIVKVRPANRRREAILEKKGASSPSWGRGGGTVDCIRSKCCCCCCCLWLVVHYGQDCTCHTPHRVRSRFQIVKPPMGRISDSEFSHLILIYCAYER